MWNVDSDLNFSRYLAEKIIELTTFGTERLAKLERDKFLCFRAQTELTSISNSE